MAAKNRYPRAEFWFGMKVLVRCCLVDKPRCAETAGFGWIIRDAAVDASRREPCNAVGKVVASRDVDKDADIVPVSFITPWPIKIKGEPIYETLLFAHVDDLEPTGEPYSWPSVPDMLVREK